jgi:hypothetical protein
MPRAVKGHTEQLTAVPPQPVTGVTAAEAAAELADAGDSQLRAEVRPGLMPLRPPAPGWVVPRAPGRAEADEGRAR